MDKDKFKQLLTTQFNVVDGDAPINVQKVSYGDVMFSIEQMKIQIDTKIQAQEEMQIEYYNENNNTLSDVCSAKIKCYIEAREMLDKIQQQIYKKVL
jgi:ribose 5-phosphate isomerase